MTGSGSRAVRAYCFAFAATLALVSPVLAAPAAPRTITVTGHGEAAGTPDEAHISAGVVTQARTAADALAQNASAMNSVFAALKQLGIPEKDIGTSGFSVNPQYTPYNANATQPPQIVGYEVSNEVDVTIDAVSKTGPAIDALVAAGANHMNSIGFSIKNQSAVFAKAREQAVSDAMTQAETLTHAAHVTLGPITSISEEAETPEPRPIAFARAEMAPAPPPTPIAVGQQTLSADVTITWEIQ